MTNSDQRQRNDEKAAQALADFAALKQEADQLGGLPELTAEQLRLKLARQKELIDKIIRWRFRAEVILHIDRDLNTKEWLNEIIGDIDDGKR